jgi:hypothetical protein
VSIAFVLADVDSGQILYSAVERARLGRRRPLGVNLGVELPQLPSRDSLSGDAVRACANKAALKIAIFLRDRQWRGSVVDIRDSNIYINAGSQQGMFPQAKLRVLAVRGLVKDLGAGTIIGEDRRPIGILKIVTVQNGFSIARIVEGCKGIKVGDRVELEVDPRSMPECDQSSKEAVNRQPKLAWISSPSPPISEPARPSR